jgi:hypothetical protein
LTFKVIWFHPFRFHSSQNLNNQKTTIQGGFMPKKAGNTTTKVLPPLPYAENALEPVISATTPFFLFEEAGNPLTPLNRQGGIL